MAIDFFPKTAKEYAALCKWSNSNTEDFWHEYALSNFQWHEPWDEVLRYDLTEGEVRWFNGAKLNITENCIDRHLSDHAEKAAIIWESNDPTEPSKTYTYSDLANEVGKAANMLRSIGVSKGDRVCIYMPMVPELAFAVLACARIGAIHSVVFAGFSSKSLSDRINDASCKWVITADGGMRGDKLTELKNIVDEALLSCSTVEKVVILKRVGNSINLTQDRDIWWHDAIKGQAEYCRSEIMDAEDPLFILYTSGSTGKPKGMVHTCAGYMVYTNYSFRNVFRYQENEIYWCTADIGWITGHSYILYGPLSAGATTLMFEGTPTYPDMGRFWDVVDKHKVNIFYTAPTAIRALEKCDISLVRSHDLSSLRVLGTVGEPINLEAWNWYNREIGHENCPIVDTWWQTETGGILISTIAGVTDPLPTFASIPLPGIQPCLMDENDREIDAMESEGRLCIKFPWPSMARTIYGDHERFKRVYFSSHKGKYFTGDGAKRDASGNYRITGRVDDVVIVSGHNLGTAEIENAIDEHVNIAEAAVVGYPHPIKGHAICAFMSCYHDVEDESTLKEEVLQLVSKIIGPIAKPERMIIVSGLPKTRSGKIMRRILRQLAAGNATDLGDISTLLNPDVVKEIIHQMNLDKSSA